MSKRHAAKFRSAYAAGALTPEQVLAFHRARFGDLRMEAGDGTDDGPGEKPADKPGGNAASKDPGPDGFPADTPVAEMTAEQQAAYWKHQSRKHEGRANERRDYDQIKSELDKLKAASLTDAEKAIEDAKAQAAKEAREAALKEILPQRVSDKLESALAGRGLKAEKIAELVEFVDYTKFLTDDGEIDTDKVKQYAETTVPANKDWPDMGQGRRGSGTAGPSVQSGKDRYAERHKAKTSA